MKRLISFVLAFLMLMGTIAVADTTMGEQNALRAAKDYLESIPFSYTGLIEQLEYEGYSRAEATYAVDNCGADWNEQAAKCAEDYLDAMAFSRDGLIEQLEYEGFTHEQAVYGVEQNGYGVSEEDEYSELKEEINEAQPNIYTYFPFSCDEGMHSFNALCQSLFDDGTLSVLYSVEESFVSEAGNIYAIYRDGDFIDSILSFEKEESTGQIDCVIVSYSDITNTATNYDKTNIVMLSMMFTDSSNSFSDADALGVAVMTSSENRIVQNGFEYTYDGGHIWQIKKLNSADTPIEISM